MAKQNKKSTPSASTPAPSAAASAKSSANGRSPMFYAGILAAIAAVIYANTLGHGFVLDDPLVTTLNKYVQKGFGGIGDILTHSYRAGSSVSTDSEYMYRPLSVVMFAIEWGIAPNSAGIHHFMNLIWYALTAGLAFLVLRQWLGAERWVLSFAAVLLFTVHPLHTEVVANIKSRDEIMSLFFALLSAYHLWRATQEGTKNALMWSMATFFLSLLSKEGSVTWVVIAPLALYCFGREGTWKTGFVLAAPFLLWFLMRYAIMGKVGYTPDFNDNQLVAASLGERWASGFMVLGKYLQLLLLPVGLSWDYSYSMLPTVGWGSMGAILGLVLHLGIKGYGLWGLFRKQALAFCALAYLASMAMYSNLVLLIGTMMGERLTYQASLWFCLAVVLLLARLVRFEGSADMNRFFSGKNATALLGVTGVLSLVFAFLTIQRNGAWKTNYDLVTTNAPETARSFRALQAIGEESLLRYADKNTPPADTAALLTQSYNGFSKSQAIRPTFNNLLGLGNVAYFKKDYATAVKWFEESYKVQNNKFAKDRLVLVYREMGRIEGQGKSNLPQAIEYFKKSMSYDSTDVQTLIDLGTAYAISQRLDLAIPYMEKALISKPDDQVLRKNLALAYQQVGMMDKAAALLK